MELLPPEININFLLYLPYQDILAFCQSNRTYYNLCNDVYFWATKAFVEFKIDPNYFYLNSKHPRLLYLDIANLYNKCILNRNNIKQCIFDIALKGDFYLVSYLLSFEFNLNAALAGASIGGHLDLVEYLLSYIQPTANILKLILDNAAESGHLNIVNYILLLGVTINCNDALSMTIINNNFEISKLLIDQCATNLDEALNLAAREDRLKIIIYLLEVKLFKPSLVNLNQALENAAKGGSINIIDYLINHGATDIDVALLIAVSYNNKELINHLVEYYRLTDLDDALYLASSNGFVDIVTYLIKHGATDLNGALESAASNGQLDVVKYLILVGADQLANALEAAIYSQSDDKFIIIRYLIDNGADLNTAYSIATRINDRATLEFLNLF